MTDKDILSYIKQIGLSPQDYVDCKDLLRRTPKKTELALFLCYVERTLFI